MTRIEIISALSRLLFDLQSQYNLLEMQQGFLNDKSLTEEELEITHEAIYHMRKEITVTEFDIKYYNKQLEMKIGV